MRLSALSNHSSIRAESGSKRAGSRELPVKDRQVPVQVNLVEAIACLIVLANVVNLFFARIGVVADVLVVLASIPAFLWTLSRGLDTSRIRLYVFVVVIMFGLYATYSAIQFSMHGFRNSVAIFTVSSTFLFFFRASGHLRSSAGFLMVLLISFGSFFFLSVSPYAVGKNAVNAAMCYYLIAMFFCCPGLLRLKTRHVSLLFSLIFVISMTNGHRSLAGSSVLLLMQYYMLSSNIARGRVRVAMFVGLIVVVVGIIALLTDPEMAVFASAADAFVTGDGSRTLMSGRQVLWPVVWQAIIDNPVLGVGPGTILADIYSTTLSAHNLYLQVGLQLGSVGFVLITSLFWSLWRAARPIGLATTRTGENLLTVVITMVAVHSLFEVFLFQNALVVGVPVWMVLGIGLGGLASEAAKLRRLRSAKYPGQEESV